MRARDSDAARTCFRVTRRLASWWTAMGMTNKRHFAFQHSKVQRTVLVDCTECADCRCRLTNGQRVGRSERFGFTVNLVAACAHLFVNEPYQIKLRDEVCDRVGVAIDVGVNRHAMSRLRSHEGTHIKERGGGRDGEQQPIAPCVVRESPRPQVNTQPTLALLLNGSTDEIPYRDAERSEPICRTGQDRWWRICGW